jgi:prophage regulatory protein
MFNNRQGAANMAPQILRLPQVKARTGLSRSTVYAMMRDGQFPLSIRLGARSIGWSDLDVDAWIAARVSASRRPG